MRICFMFSLKDSEQVFFFYLIEIFVYNLNWYSDSLRRDEAPSPAPSHLSVRSEQSMDWPIAFNNETPSYNGYGKYENFFKGVLVA